MASACAHTSCTFHACKKRTGAQLSQYWAGLSAGTCGLSAFGTCRVLLRVNACVANAPYQVVVQCYVLACSATSRSRYTGPDRVTSNSYVTSLVYKPCNGRVRRRRPGRPRASHNRYAPGVLRTPGITAAAAAPGAAITVMPRVGPTSPRARATVPLTSP